MAAVTIARYFFTLSVCLTLMVSLLGCPEPTELATVPYVSGLLQADAEAALIAAGLTVGEVMTSYSDVIEAGHVVLQNPYPGIQVAPGTAVTLVVSAGPVPAAVPNVVGLTQAAAEAALTGAGFTSSVTQVFSATVAVGTVVSQTPAGGENAAEGSEVALEVSKGPDIVTVPAVTGMTQSEATLALTDARLALGTVTELWSDSVEAGRVISQDPVGGMEVSAGSEVALDVSKGPQPLMAPALAGLTLDEAQQALAALGLVLGGVTEVVDATAAPDVVVGQAPLAEEVVEPASAVDVVVSLGSDEMVLHTQVWADVIGAAAADKQSKYGIYASRSLMVAHPEVYLAADAVWMEQLVTVCAGWKAEYEHRDRQDDGDYWYTVGGPIYAALERETTLDGTEFDWDDFQWENHRANATSLRDLYDARAPFRNWLDMRLPVMWNAIKGVAWKTPLLSLGEALYFQMRTDYDDVYLLVTDAERAYVAVVAELATVLYDPYTGDPIMVEAVEGEIVLAMNGESAWYPLMGRDDTGADAALDSVVTAFCTAGAMPLLTRAEDDMLADIAAATALATDADRAWATAFASRFGDLDGWKPAVVRDFMSQLLPDQYAAYGLTGRTPYEWIALNLAVTEVANRLSPAAAVLAFDFHDNSDSIDAAMLALSDTFDGWFGRDDVDGVFGAYSEIWLPSLDDKAISKVGYALSEACATGAALYIADVDGWEAWISHGWLGANKGTESLSGVYTASGGRSLSVGVFDPLLADCMSGPLFGSGYGEPVNALVYRIGDGFLYTGECEFGFPFTGMTWAQASNLAADMGLRNAGARFATGNPNLVGPISVTELQTMIADLAEAWPQFLIP